MSAYKLPPLPAIKDIVKLYKLRAKKQLSQNFILNYNLCRRIVRKAGNLKGHYVCEVGPGPGGLTRAILEAGCSHLSVIEKDRRFLPSLQELNRASGGRMSIFQGDVLTFQMYNVFPEELTQRWGDEDVGENGEELELKEDATLERSFDGVVDADGELVGVENDIVKDNNEEAYQDSLLRDISENTNKTQINSNDSCNSSFPLHNNHTDAATISKSTTSALPKAHIIGNLPFSVSTALVIRWLREMSRREGAWSRGRVPLTLTFQNEVAQRMVARPMDVVNRCRLSVMCQNWCHVNHRFVIKGEAFVPPPEVDVGVVQLIPRKRPLIPDVPFELVEKLLRHLFHYRQKNCKSSLATLFPPDRVDLTQRLLSESGVGGDWVSYTIDMHPIARLCEAYKRICGDEPWLVGYDYRSKENAAIWRKKSKFRVVGGNVGSENVTGDNSGVGVVEVVSGCQVSGKADSVNSVKTTG